MAQLTVYMDPQIMKKITMAAKTKKTSVSQWVKQQLTRALESSWPENYFDLFGSFKGIDLTRPEQQPYTHDSKRESL